MLYSAAISFVSRAIVMGSTDSLLIGKWALFTGAVSFFIPLIILMGFGFLMVRIKSRQFVLRQDT